MIRGSAGVSMIQGIGDPTFIGWFTVVAYVIAALLCWVAAARARAFDGRARAFWMFFTLFMIALGINKQLDLQTAFTVVLKHFAKSTGWYDDRRIFQAMFIFIIGFFGLAFGFLAWVWTSRTLPQHRMTVLGGIFLVCFIVIRAASFHHIDEILGRQIAFFRVNHALELSGIGCVALGAFRARRGILVGEEPRTAQVPHNWRGSTTGYPH